MPSSSHGSRLGRLLQQECQAATAALAGRGDVHARVHEARKAIRRARSLLALVDADLEVESSDALLRRTGDSLGMLRDAYSVARTAGKLARRTQDPRWSEAEAALDARADRLARRELAADPGFASRVRAIRRAAKQLRSLPWDTLASADIRAGLVRQSRRADKAARRAKKQPLPQNLHRWRRRVRRLRMQVDALAALKISPLGSDPAVSRRLHALSDELGWHQDLEVLAETLRRKAILEGRINALTAQGRIQGIVMTLFPVFLMGVLYLMQPSMSLMFTTTIGWVVLGAIAFMLALGYMMIRKIVAIDI